MVCVVCGVTCAMSRLAMLMSSATASSSTPGTHRGGWGRQDNERGEERIEMRGEREYN